MPLLFDPSSWPFEWTLRVAGWLGTYAVHSTILTVLVWVACRALPSHSWSLRLKDVLLKTALVGALLTATLQHSTGLDPLFGTYGMETAPQIVTYDSSFMNLPPWRQEELLKEISSFNLPTSSEFSITRTQAQPPPPWPGWITLGSLVLSLVGLALFTLKVARLRRWLTPRTRLARHPLNRFVESSRRRFGIRAAVRISISNRIRTPMVVGRYEVCLPPRALNELPEDEQHVMLAHELAHIARGDRYWLLLASALTSMFFFQPLHRIVRRDLHDVSELLCDEWAANETTRRLNLARCLTRVASWFSTKPSPYLVPEMAGHPSSLKERIERLTAAPHSPWDLAPRYRRLLPLSALLLLSLIAGVAPGMSRKQEPQDKDDVGGVSLIKEEGTIHGSLIDGDIQVTFDGTPIDEECLERDDNVVLVLDENERVQGIFHTHNGALSVSSRIPYPVGFLDGPLHAVTEPDATMGIRVHEITPDSASQRAGLRTGDVVTKVDGVPVASLAALYRELIERLELETLALDIRRGQTELSLDVDFRPTGVR